MSYISLLHQSEMGDSRECAEWCTTTLSGSPAKDFSTRERQHKKKDITHQTRAESFNITQRRMLAEVFILSRQQKECKIKMKILLYRAIYIYQVLCRPPGGGPRLDRRARIQFGAGTFWRKTMKNRGRNKQKRDLRGVTTDLGGGQGRNKQKRYRHKT